ncbi:MAG: FAD-binding oxidoreductase [Streptomyces sp.]|nr:FAD-binding oxidoreductase [Streptomyces sp.]
MSADVVVIGAGVAGLTTAVRLAESGLRVRVDADLPVGETTSAAAGAMWDPYLAEPQDAVARWARATLSELTALSSDKDTGIRVREGTQESRTPCPLPAWADLVGARRCLPGELRDGFVAGWRYRAPVVDMPRYLEYLTRRFVQAGGAIRRHHHESLSQAMSEAPVVVNCSGSGARTLGDDPDVEPVRGRLVVVENPGIESFFCDDTPGAEELTYIYPHSETVVLGGTSDRGAWDRAPDDHAAEQIVRRCVAVEPSLAGARVIEQRVGLRPVRKQVRLTAEQLGGGLLVHNYGHGGAGVTLSWGCAEEVLQRVRGSEASS